MAAGVHKEAELPRFYSKTFDKSEGDTAVDAPSAGRKAVLYATCFVNYNNPGIGEAAQKVLVKNGVETETVYPGMLRHAATGAGRYRTGCREREKGRGGIFPD